MFPAYDIHKLVNSIHRSHQEHDFKLYSKIAITAPSLVFRISETIIETIHPYTSTILCHIKDCEVTAVQFHYGNNNSKSKEQCVPHFHLCHLA